MATPGKPGLLGPARETCTIISGLQRGTREVNALRGSSYAERLTRRTRTIIMG
jgi:hypothetical protein